MMSPLFTALGPLTQLAGNVIFSSADPSETLMVGAGAGLLVGMTEQQLAPTLTQTTAATASPFIPMLIY